jgi:hypothetical protein
MEKLYEALFNEFMEVHKRHDAAAVPVEIQPVQKFGSDSETGKVNKPFPIKYVRQRGQKITYLSTYEIEKRKKLRDKK